MKELIIAQRAYCQMLVQLELNLDTETGGVLLGFVDDSKITIVESVDSGPRAILHPGSVTFDAEYVNYSTDITSKLYLPVLSFVGFWHKHNHSMMPPFSAADNDLNKQAAECAGGSAVSLLFQKTIEGTYVLRSFYVTLNDKYLEMDFKICSSLETKYAYKK